MGRGSRPLKAVVWWAAVVFFSACAAPMDPGADTSLEVVPPAEVTNTPAPAEPPRAPAEEPAPPPPQPPPPAPPPLEPLPSGTEPVHMSAWVLTGGDAVRQVRLRLWRSEPVEVQLRVEASRRQASLGGALPSTVRVGPEPVTLDLPWNVGRDCEGDRADITFTATVGRQRFGTALATAWLRACAATGMTSLLDTGEWPSAVRPADLDGDGRPELIVAHKGAPSLLVLFAGEAGYGYRRRYVHVGRPSDWMLLRDLNADGLSDVVLLERGSGEVLVLLGERQRLFAPPRGYALGGPAVSVAFADVDADGQSDIVTLDRDARRYHVLAGRSDGTFTALASGAAPEAATSVLLGHLTDDRYPDLAFEGVNLLAVGDGTGHFVPSHSVEKGLHLDAADVDGEGAPELLSLETGNNGTMRLEALHVDAQGRLSSREVTTSSAVEVYPPPGQQGGNLRIADFNGDGRRDFLFLKGGGDSASLCLRNTDGTCTGHALYQGYCQSAWDAVDVDVEGDAVPELVFAVTPGCSSPGFLTVRRAHELSRSTVPPLRVENPVSGVAILPGEGDIRKGIVVGAHDVTLITLVGGSMAEGPVSHFDVGGWVRAVATGDFTGDGLADIAALNERGEVVLLVGRGGGRFERRAAPLATFSLDADPYWEALMQAGDFNRDGRDDLLVASRLFGGVTLLTSSGGGFTPSKPFGDVFASVAVGDLNRDGWLDALIGSVSYLARPDGSFARAWQAPNSLYTAVLRDLDGDGILDLASGGDLFSGQGDGSFRETEGSLSYGSFLTAGDWNGDGRVDLLAAESYGMGEGSSTLYSQGRDHRFTEAASSLSRSAVRGAWSTDFEGDAQDELLLLTAHTYEPTAYWRLELFHLPRAP